MDNSLRGIALIVGATMLFSISDAIAKLLGQDLPEVEIGVFRYIIFVTMAAVFCAHAKIRPWRVAVPGAQIWRGLGLVLSALCFIEALRHMPLADAASVGFVSPLLITALSVPMLGEVVGIRRWTAVAVGFLGVLIVMRPGTGAFQIESLWVLGSSSSWALASVLTRQMAGKDNAATTLLWSSAVGLIVVTLMLPFVWVVPTVRDLWLCAALGVIASSGQFLLVQAYRHAEATTLAPFSYVQLAWSVSLGYLLWGTLPDAWTWVGAAVIVASGIYTVHRERTRSRERQLAAPAAV